jgi:hypothetical protein
MARPERVELPTFWFVARRSIQLSYGRAPQKYYHTGARPIYHTSPQEDRHTFFISWNHRSLHFEAAAQLPRLPTPSASLTKLRPCASLPDHKTIASVTIVTISKPAMAH